MPYIPHNDRGPFDPHIDQLSGLLNELKSNDEIAGALNYVISRLTWQLCGHSGKGERRYARMNAVVGAIESAKAEFQRRVVAPYEDEKIESAGDVGEQNACHTSACES